MKKKLMAVTLAVLTMGAVLAGASSVLAQDGNENQQSLVQKIAAKFSLKESDVQTVFDESREQRQEEMQLRMKAELETRLSTAVTDKKITAAQKQMIIAKHNELHEQMEDQRDAMQNMTRDERKAAMEARRTELQSWAKQNNIDSTFVAGGNGGMMGKGDGMGMGRGHRDN